MPVLPVPVFDVALAKIEVMKGRLPHSESLPAVQEELLGEPLTVREAATLLGCSPWTLRQRYLLQGLPYLRATTTGKLTFFRSQIIRWILERQGGQK